MEPTLADAVEAALGTAAISITPLSGGSVGEVYRATLESGSDVVIKVDRGANPKLNLEGDMLQYLRDHSNLPVPEVFFSTGDLLVLEMLPGTSTFSSSAESNAAELLAELHNIKAPKHGFDYDTLIGSLHQPNLPTASWLEFFRDQRLLHMAQEAFSEGRMGLDTLNRIEKFASHLDTWLLEPDHPSLLHGDVWTTNVLADADRITGFIDPAIYFGHPEIELAFITLFNTFGNTFFDRYHELRPIADDFFNTRRDIYNLYPLLVHVRLFGGSYLRSVESTIARHGY
jgi:fructosamine-3-kinase